MWKSAVFFTLLLGYTSAGSASWSEDISVHNNRAVTGIHYSQHESSVYAARKAAAERLQQHQAAALVASGSSTGPCDTICYNSYTADAGDAETIGQGTVGFAPAVGSSQKYSSSSSRHEASVSNVHAAPVVYPVASSTGARSSFSSSSSSRLQSSSLNAGQPVLAQLYGTGVESHGRTHSNVIATGGSREGTYIQPLVYPVPAPQTHASQTSFNERSSQERSVVSRPVVTRVIYTAAPVGGASHASSDYATRSSFVAAADEQQHVQPVVYPTANSDYSRNYAASQHQDQQYRQYPAKPSTYVVYPKPQYYASGRARSEDAATSQTTYDSAGRVVNLNIIQPIPSVERVEEHSRTQQRAESTQTVQRQPDLYQARGGIEHQEQDTQLNLESDVVDGTSTDRTDLAAPVAPRREQTGSVRTGTSYVASVGSTNRHANVAQSSEGQRRVTYHRTPEYVPVVSGSGYESASEQQQRHVSSHTGNSFVVPVVVQPMPQTSSSTANRYSSSSSSAQEHRANTHGGAGSPGTYYTAAGSVPSYGSQYASAAHSNSRYKALQGGSFHHYPIANDEMGRRFGATGVAGGYGADTDLHDIMSESETLARLQAQNVHNGAVTGSATIDTDTRFGGGSDAEGLGTMPGGFQRTKSWSSSSKWASEQHYGDDGKPKTFSMLSTAESEKHNINGKTTGYKAATTTLEDDGKVSTYSLHTA
uniref:Uncharacterized protein n=1 Tax=Anopheles atroparvus TaxID=41427 RepID=A0AAG5DWG5_ANOAO